MQTLLAVAERSTHTPAPAAPVWLKQVVLGAVVQSALVVHADWLLSPLTQIPALAAALGLTQISPVPAGQLAVDVQALPMLRLHVCPPVIEPVLLLLSTHLSDCEFEP